MGIRFSHLETHWSEGGRAGDKGVSIVSTNVGAEA